MARRRKFHKIRYWRIVRDREDRVTMRTSSLSVSALIVCALLTHASAALGQAYPSRPVRFLSGQPPGGATDFFARMVAQKLNESWKQAVIVEHRPGASGSIAVELTVKA